MEKKTKKQVDIWYFSLLTIGVIFFLSTLIILHVNVADQIIYIQSDNPATFETSSKFLSIGLDDVVIAEDFRNFNMTSEKLTAMIKYLSPGYLRIGGNLADRLKFSLYNHTDKTSEDFYRYLYSEDSSNSQDYPNITLRASDWLQLSSLANKSNMEIFFGLNALQRFKNGSWDSRNAETMIKFSDSHGLKVNWELGNEPNSFKHKFNKVVNATQMAKDFGTLRGILNKYKKYRNSLLVGPDVTRPQKNPESEIYLEEFVKNAHNIVNKITWHQYYLNGYNTTANDFLDVKTFDLLRYQINKVKEITNNTGKPIWLGETSSAYGGGAQNLSDRFIGSFLWVDKLGLAAKMGVEVVMRQSIFHGNYSLLDDNYNPNPDWWISIIYKKFVGTKVVPFYNITDETVRLYVHCTSSVINQGIVIFGINIGKTAGKVKILGINNVLYAYVFQLQTKNLNSKDVYCNGNLLKMLPGNKVPNVEAIRTSINPYLIIPPYSIVFWIVPNVKVQSCV